MPRTVFCLCHEALFNFHISWLSDLKGLLGAITLPYMSRELKQKFWKALMTHAFLPMLQSMW